MVTKKQTTKTIKSAKLIKPVKEKTAKIKLDKKISAEPKKITEIKEKSIELQTIRPVTEKYYESIGRRKRAIARVRVYTKKSTDTQVSEDKALIVVNDKPYNEYFRTLELQNTVETPLKKLKSLNRFKATAKVFGGGISGQADAIKLGLSRALVLFDQNFSKKLRKSGYLTRDSREKERRKYGLKKARKAPQWAKR
ncbi:MAG: 30S ribosomal protein S9 [Candidatus Yanofskybacteria bacterium]|nr:30S ribosomal protein S9 [Candidatus Yanofskybacteria bacterium]